MQTSASRVQPFKLPVKDEINLQNLKHASEFKLKPIEAPKNDLDVTKKISLNVVRSLFDALVRGVTRFVEKFIDDQVLRVLYRLGTESVRKISEISLVNYFENKKLSKKDCIIGLLRALEHVPSTSIVEPNLFGGKLQRILAGLGNMSVRFATRFGFYKVNAISREELGIENALDEFLSRSVFRAIYVDSTNPVVGIGIKALEQLLINLNIHVVKPLGRLFPNLKD